MKDEKNNKLYVNNRERVYEILKDNNGNISVKNGKIQTGSTLFLTMTKEQVTDNTEITGTNAGLAIINGYLFIGRFFEPGEFGGKTEAVNTIYVYKCSYNAAKSINKLEYVGTYIFNGGHLNGAGNPDSNHTHEIEDLSVIDNYNIAIHFNVWGASSNNKIYKLNLKKLNLMKVKVKVNNQTVRNDSVWIKLIRVKNSRREGIKVYRVNSYGNINIHNLEKGSYILQIVYSQYGLVNEEYAFTVNDSFKPYTYFSWEFQRNNIK